ncbi:MerR family transcriptional regulator [Aestuariibacter halophilus]|uniref:MerR family transcriptional regulator n=1 Tax=Fluctibacter halophilus TaxID=226011 RepID=A0ABS8G8U9_9ALTE|nr:MerR family transcriptional regulator [Aestuariibacter halophilus]MCC2616975.1 MerR family transcriptional regulator [Aestuariibacter halophilus]
MYQIGELAKRAGCSVQTVRYYESRGIIHATQRTDANYRLYDDQAVSSLLFVRRCRQLGIGLADIHQILTHQANPDRDCHAIDGLIEAHLKTVDQKIHELQTLREHLRALGGACPDNGTVESCQVLQQLQRVSVGDRQRTKQP